MLGWGQARERSEERVQWVLNIDKVDLHVAIGRLLAGRLLCTPHVHGTLARSRMQTETGHSQLCHQHSGVPHAAALPVLP